MASPVTRRPDDRPQTLRERAYIIIFEADTPAGKAFDVALLFAILASVAAVMAESVPEIRHDFRRVLVVLEWVFTIFFTIEYVVRLACVPNPWGYARSFFGIVDLLAILPTFVSVLIPGAQSLLVIRGLRLLRIFRVFKLGRFLGEAAIITRALSSSREKVVVFLGTILVLVTILGAAMYLIEGPESGFTSIPTSVYWAIVTLTTVGYGDITPESPLGKTLAAAIMVLGYSIIAVPTGIVTAEIVEQVAESRPRFHTTRHCGECMSEGHPVDAVFCMHCGERLPGMDGNAAGDEDVGHE